jgi:beta-lactamase regulating signal transducer with metallopeptidase domain
MSPVEVLANPVARQLTLALLHFVWQGLAIAVLLVLAVELLGIRRPQSRYACSLVALLVMLVCPVATFLWISTGNESLRASGFIPEAYSSPMIDGEPANIFAGVESTDSWQAAINAAQPYALAAWLLGVAIFAGRLSGGAIGVLRLRQKLIPLPLDLASNVERLGRRLQIDALPLVFLSRRVTEAMAVGVVRPLVLIPAAWVTEMPLEMLEAVIAHELAHLRRRDLWVNLLQRVAEAALFYHPAIWWLSRRLRQERELCADALAVAATGRRLEYAEALEQVARWRQADVGPALAAFMRGGKNMRLLERVRNVLGLGAEGDRSRLWPAGLLVLALPLGLWIAALGMGPAVADDDRDDGDRPRVEREDEDDDDDDDREEGRREKEDDDVDDDDEKEGRGEKEDDSDDDEKEGKGEKDDDDDDDREEKKFFNKEERKEGEEREEKEVRKDGDVKKEGPRDGEVKKEGPRDGEVKKDGPRDGDAPKKVIKEGARDGDAPKKVIKDGDRPIKEGARDGEKKIVKEGAGPDGAIYELKALVSKLMAENERLRAELAAVRGGKEGFKKEGGDREPGVKKELGPEQREARERKEAELKELRARKERAAAEQKEGAARKEREGDEKALIEKKRAIAEKEEAAAREKLREAIEQKEGGDKKEGDAPK